MKSIYCVTILICTLISSNISAQTVFYEEIFHGGVTGDGIGTSTPEIPYSFNVNIPVNSTIKKAFLFVTSTKTKYSFLDSTFLDRSISFNNYQINLSNNDTITNFSASGYPIGQIYDIGVIVIDVTNMVSSSQNSYILIPPLNQSFVGENGFFSKFYLYVVYENLSMEKVNAAIILNKQNADAILSYNIDFLNPIDNTKDVGFSFHSTWFCDTIRDGSYVSVNNNLLGLTGGSEGLFPNCTGVWGSFYYQNSTLYGLGNDTPDNYMSGVDALANIQPYITNPNLFNVSFQYQTPDRAYMSNPVLQLFFTYTTPCDTFSVSITPDTTICIGNQLQLQVTGGQTYQWSTSNSTNGNGQVEGLSCSDCPNPIFTGNRTMNYTVRVWNSDSCSVVLPICVRINNPQKVNCFAYETQCGVNEGFISAPTFPSEMGTWYVVTPTNDTLNQPINNTFPNLGGGNYTVYYIDNAGCKSSDTMVVIETIHNTVADFTVTPQTGAAPLLVEVSNQSQYATDYSWLINGVPTNLIPNVVFDSTGVYEIGLIAWALNESCADTTWKTVYVYDTLYVDIPNVFTPSGDGVNEFFSVKVNYALDANLVILNRWGNVVCQWSGTLQKGANNLWDGKSKEGTFVGDGVYFYRIELSNLQGFEKERKVAGYVHVIGN
jgi:gliding motility-associated-like protein